MAFFSSLFSSFKKTKKLYELQMKIAPPGRIITANDILRGFETRDKALEDYLNICENDEGISNIMNEYNLQREDLREIYSLLNASGAGIWLNSHYVPLSSIAYSEPLLYIVESKKNRKAWAEIVTNIIHYWEGRISKGGLLKQLKKE